MSDSLAAVGMVLLVGTVLTVVGAYLLPRLVLWVLSLIAQHFLG